MKIMLSTISILSLATGCTHDATESPAEPTTLLVAESPGDVTDGKMDRVPRVSPDAEPELPVATAVVTATTRGALCALDPVTGALIHDEAGTFTDVLGLPQQPGHVLTTSWLEQGGGELAEIALTPAGMTHVHNEALPFEDTRLVHGPQPLLALGASEGTTLFTATEGRAVFGVSSFVVRSDDDGVDLWLLENTPISPLLSHLRWEGALRELQRGPTLTPSFSCAPRLVRGAPSPWIVGVYEGTLRLQSPQGASSVHLEQAAAANACVEDALWLKGTQDVAVVTGPEVRVHLVSMADAHEGDTLVMAERLWHDPRPHRRLAYDSARSRLWIALSERLDVRLHTPDGHLDRELAVEPGCDAESVTLAW